jgi:hypothetical protein
VAGGVTDMGVALIEREGAQLRVEDGVGRVVDVKPKGNRNAQVIIEAPHLRQPVQAWADGANAALVAAVMAAQQSQQPTPYRIEVKRKAKVDPSIPFDQLTNDQKVRDLVALGPDAESNPWGNNAQTEPLPDPAAQASQPPPADPAPTPGPVAPENPPAAATAPPAAGSEPTQGDPERVQLALRQLSNAVRDREGDEIIRTCRVLAEDLGATAEQIAAAMNPQLTLALKCLRQMTVDGITPSSPAYLDQRQACVDLGATVTQLRWAQGITDDPGADVLAGALARHRDPDKVRERAPAPYNGHADAPPPPVAARSGLGTAGAAVPRGLADPKPWQARHDTGPLAGQLNLSSYEVGAVIDLVELAQRILIRRARAAASEDGDGQVDAPTVEAVQALAGALKLAADRVQVAIRGGSVDRQSGLYRRAVRAVREAVDWYPVPAAGAPAAELAGWHHAIVDHASTTILVALVLLDEPAGDTP